MSMIRKSFVPIILIMILSLSACSKEEEPEQRLVSREETATDERGKESTTGGSEAPERVIVGMRGGDFRYSANYRSPGPESQPDIKRVYEDPETFTSGLLIYKRRIYIGTSDYRLLCIDNDGRLIWDEGLDGPLLTAPVLGGDVIYSCSAFGMLTAHDWETGDLIWKVQLPGRPLSEPGLGISSADDSSGLNGAAEGVLVSSLDGILFSIDAGKGNARWEYQSSAGLSAGPVIEGEKVYISTQNGSIFGIDDNEGALDSQFFISGLSSDNLFVISAGRIIAASKDLLTVIDVNTGKVHWEIDIEDDSALAGPPACDGSRIYTADLDGVFNSYDISSGEFLWSFRSFSPLVGQCSIDSEGRLYLADEEGMVYALDSSSGEQIWSVDCEEALLSSLIPYEGALYCPTKMGKILVLR